MFGVVLWSDTQEQKAVIWCEDHGDLAFYRETSGNGPVALDAGDWVQFDMTTERHLRFAHNPRLVAEGVYSGLAESLSAHEALPNTDPTPRRIGADILPFLPSRAGKKERRNKHIAAQLA